MHVQPQLLLPSTGTHTLQLANAAQTCRPTLPPDEGSLTLVASTYDVAHAATAAGAAACMFPFVSVSVYACSMPCAAALTIAVLTAWPVLAVLLLPLLLLSRERGSFRGGLVVLGQVDPGGLQWAVCNAADSTHEWMRSCVCWCACVGRNMKQNSGVQCAHVVPLLTVHLISFLNLWGGRFPPASLCRSGVHEAGVRQTKHVVHLTSLMRSTTGQHVSAAAPTSAVLQLHQG
jgi:hypothetical protein